jgi:hypothetical protein
MEKPSVLAVVVCLVFVISLIPNSCNFAKAVNTSVTVLSYSSYVSPTGHFVVLGEVQNTGSHTLESVSLNVAVSASDGSTIAAGTTDAFVHNFLPSKRPLSTLTLEKSTSMKFQKPALSTLAFLMRLQLTIISIQICY